MVFISKEKLHVSAYSGHIQVLEFSTKRVLYNMHIIYYIKVFVRT